MHGRWWRWLGTVLAVVCGLVFSWSRAPAWCTAASIAVTDAACCQASAAARDGGSAECGGEMLECALPAVFGLRLAVARPVVGVEGGASG